MKVAGGGHRGERRREPGSVGYRSPRHRVSFRVTETRRAESALDNVAGESGGFRAASACTRRHQAFAGLPFDIRGHPPTASATAARRNASRREVCVVIAGSGRAWWRRRRPCTERVRARLASGLDHPEGWRSSQRSLGLEHVC